MAVVRIQPSTYGHDQSRRRTSVHGDRVTVNVKNGRAGGAAGRAGGGLEVERIEVVVATDTVDRRGAVQPRQRACQNGELWRARSSSG